MIPVDQTVSDPVRGTCLSACVASILEIPAEGVPWFNAEPADEWWQRLDAWCTLRRCTPIYLNWAAPAPSGYAIAGVPSRRSEGKLHAVVCLDGRVVHDPQPDNRHRAPYDEAEVKDWIILQPWDAPLHESAIAAGYSEKP